MNEDNKQIDRELEGLSTPEKIQKAALAEFAEFGLAGARVDRISKRAGVNKAMLYYHFSSKDNLYHKCIENYIQRTIGAIHVEVSTGENLEDILTGIVNIYRSILAENPYAIKILLREMAQPHSQISDKLASVIKDYSLQNKLVGILENAVETGTAREIDIPQAMVSFITMNVGYYIMAPVIDKVWNVENKKEFLDRRMKAVVDLFMNGVKVR